MNKYTSGGENEEIVWRKFYKVRENSTHCDSHSISICWINTWTFTSLSLLLINTLSQGSTNYSFHLFLYDLWTKNEFTFFNGWKKSERFISCNLKIVWNSNISVHK